MRFELQRIAALDEAVAPAILVDVRSIFLASGDDATFWAAAETINEAARRAGRSVAFVVAPGPEQPVGQAVPQPASFSNECAKRKYTSVESREPLLSLADATSRSASIDVTAVLVDVDEYAPAAQALAGNIRSILDVSTGRLSQPQELEARARQRTAIATASADPSARASVQSWLAALVRPPPPTGYACAHIRRGISGLELKELVCLLPDGWHAAGSPHEAERLLRLLLQAHPNRWFAPRCVDLLAWMIERGLPLPERALEPAWLRTLLDPEAPFDLVGASPRLLDLEPEARQWLGDDTRRAEPPRVIDRVARELPALDAALGELLQQKGLTLLVEEDIARTLPVLARVEARGVVLSTPVGFPTWAAFEDRLWADHAKLSTAIEQKFGPFNWLENRLTIRVIELNYGKLPAAERSSPVEHQVERHFAQNADLDMIVRAREVDAFLRAHPLSDFTQAGSVHAVSVLESNGRIRLQRPGLQSLHRRGQLGTWIRSALRARDGYCLVAVDYNGFEARLAADLSKDPVLVAACKEPDVNLALAGVLFRTATPTKAQRELTKSALLAMFYGQSKRQFWFNTVTLSRAAAEQLYDDIEQLLPTFVAFRRDEHALIDAAKQVQTRGGWVRALRANLLAQRRREGFNALVQGLAADIFRRVLRELDQALRALDAFIVHHAFDEVFVEAPVGREADVARVVREIMEFAPLEAHLGGDPLVRSVRLVAKEARIGATWADVV